MTGWIPGVKVLCCIFVAAMDEGYLQLKSEDVTEPDLFGVKANHSSVAARKRLQGGFFFAIGIFCCFGIVTVLELQYMWNDLFLKCIWNDEEC